MIKMHRIIAILLLSFSAGIFGSYLLNMFLDTQIGTPEIMVFTNQPKTYNSTVYLNLNNSGVCTGSVISDNYVLTAAHCLTNSFGIMTTDPIYVESADSIIVQVKAKAVALDVLRDVGFINGDFVNFKHAAVDFKGTHVKSGMPVVSCGFPGGSRNLYCVQLYLEGNYFFRHRAVGAPILKGMSGGPVTDMDNVIIGVNSAVNGDSVLIGPVVGILESLGIYGY